MNNWRKIFSWEIEEFDDPSWESLSRRRRRKILRSTRYEGHLNLSDIPIMSLGNLEYVGGHLDLFNTLITNFDNLKYVKGDLHLSYSPIQSLGSLEYVGGDLNLSYTPITNLGNLEYVGGYLDLSDTPIMRMDEEERARILTNVRVRRRIYFNEG